MSQTVWLKNDNALIDFWQFSGPGFTASDTYNTGSDSNVIAPHIIATPSRNSGKYYFEIVYVTDSEWGGMNWSVFGGIRTPDWENYYRVRLGNDATGFAICPPNQFRGTAIQTHHNSVVTTHAGVSHAGNYNSSYYNYGTSFRRGPCIRCAVDYDSGKVWLGLGGSFNWDSYNTNLTLTTGEGYEAIWAGNGDPATGATPTYTFTPNTAYAPAWASNGGCVVLLKTHAGTFLHPIPAGFQPYDILEPYTHAVLTDAPYSLYVAQNMQVFISDSAFLRIDMEWWDFSGNRRLLSNLNGGVVTLTQKKAMSNLQKLSSLNVFSRRAPFPSSASSFSFESIIFLQADCRAEGSNGTWDEGTGIFHNYDIRMVIRGRKVIVSAGSVSVTMTNDLLLGGHHLVMRMNETTLFLTVDNVLIGSVALSGGALRKEGYWSVGSLHTENYVDIVGTRIIDSIGAADRLLTSHLAVYDYFLSDEQIESHWKTASYEWMQKHLIITPRQSRIDTRNVIQR